MNLYVSASFITHIAMAFCIGSLEGSKVRFQPVRALPGNMSRAQHLGITAPPFQSHNTRYKSGRTGGLCTDTTRFSGFEIRVGSAAFFYGVDGTMLRGDTTRQASTEVYKHTASRIRERRITITHQTPLRMTRALGSQ